jgi:uncharacterized membrane protein/uncharacterized lipoprotein YbaY
VNQKQKNVVVIALAASVIWFLNASRVVAEDETKLYGTWERVVPGTEAEADPPLEAIVLMPDNDLGFLGIASMGGLSWSLESGDLILVTNTLRYPEGDATRAKVLALEEDRFKLSDEAGYLRGAWTRRKDATRLIVAVDYVERIAVAPGNIIEATLEQRPAADGATETITSHRILNRTMNPPWEVSLFLDLATLDQSSTYSVSGQIINSHDGGVSFASGTHPIYDPDAGPERLTAMVFANIGGGRSASIAGLLANGTGGDLYDADLVDGQVTHARITHVDDDSSSTLDFDERGALSRFRTGGPISSGRREPLLDLQFEDGALTVGETWVNGEAVVADPEQVRSAVLMSEQVQRQVVNNRHGGHPDLSCSGEEPFWSASLMGRILETRSTEDLDGTEYFVRGQWDAANPPSLALTTDNQSVSAVVRPIACDSSMVDAASAPYRIDMDLRGRALSGCCVVGEGPVFEESMDMPVPATIGAVVPEVATAAPQTPRMTDKGSAAEPPHPVGHRPRGTVFRASDMGPDDWPLHLERLLPVIFACLDTAEGTGERVIVAWPMKGRMAAVHISNNQGERLRCVASQDADRSPQIQSLGSDVPMHPQEGTFIFTTVADHPGTDACLLPSEVIADGVQVGWLSTPQC